jgi:hypothetical protein
VLGGAKVVELDANGNKIAGYVYANGVRVAEQEVEPTFGGVKWQHLNPGTNSWVETASNRLAGRQEMDPDGAEVGTADPWVVPQAPPTYENLKGEEPLYIEGGDPFDYVSGYTLDGLPMTRSELNRILGKLGVSRVFDVYHVDPEFASEKYRPYWTRPEFYHHSFTVDPPQQSRRQAPQGPSISRPGWNGKQEPFAWTVEEKEKVTRALDLALAALTSSNCEAFLRGQSDNARNVLEGMAKSSISFLNRSHTRPIKDGIETLAWTRTTSGIPLTKPQVDLYAGFFDNRRQFGLNPDQTRALTLLHELGHITYEYFHSSLAKLIGAKNLSDEQVDRLIFEKCFNVPLGSDIAE